MTRQPRLATALRALSALTGNFRKLEGGLCASDGAQVSLPHAAPAGSQCRVTAGRFVGVEHKGFFFLLLVSGLLIDFDVAP